MEHNNENYELDSVSSGSLPRTPSPKKRKFIRDSSSPESPDKLNRHNFMTRLQMYGSQDFETEAEKRLKRRRRFKSQEQVQQVQDSQELVVQDRENRDVAIIPSTSFSDSRPQFLEREINGKLVIFDPLDDGRYICGKIKGVKGTKVELEDTFTGVMYKVPSRKVILVSRIDKGEPVYMRSRIFGKPLTGPHTLSHSFEFGMDFQTIENHKFSASDIMIKKDVVEEFLLTGDGISIARILDRRNRKVYTRKFGKVKISPTQCYICTELSNRFVKCETCNSFLCFDCFNRLDPLRCPNCRSNYI